MAETLRSPRVFPDSVQDRSDLAALQAGDERGLNRLIARWQRPLFQFAYRYLRSEADAREVAAEVFVVLYRRSSHLSAQSNLSAWLFTVTANRCRNQLRWRQRHPVASPEAAVTELLSAEGEDPDQALLGRELRERLAAAVDQLPHDLKVVLLLHHYESLSYREIAAVVGCGERGVESRLYRARQRLKQVLGHGT